MENIFDKEVIMPAVPSPTLDQAQKAIIRSAENSNDEGAKLVQTGLLKLISIQPNCELDSYNGNIICKGKISKQATKQQKAEIIDVDRMHFHLKGSAWVYGRAPS